MAFTLSKLTEYLSVSSIAPEFSGSALTMGLNIVGSKKLPRPAVIGRESTVYYSPLIMQERDYTYLIDISDQDKIGLINHKELAKVAAIGSLLNWQHRLEYYIYALASSVVSDQIPGVHMIVASILDSVAITYLKGKHYTKMGIEEYFFNFVRNVKKDHLTYLPRLAEQENYVVADLFGVMDDLRHSLGQFRHYVARRGVPAPVIVQRVGSQFAGVGKGGVTEEITANLLEPRTAKFIQKIRAIARMYAEEPEKYDYTMNPPDFTYWNYGILVTDFVPQTSSNKKGVFFVVDTSGSVSEFELQLFVSEVYSAARKYKLKGKLIWFSGGVEGEVDLQDIKKPKFEVVGRGGTELAPALEYVKEQAEELDLKDAAVLVLSDGGIFDADKVNELGKIVDGPQVFFYTQEPVSLNGWTVEPLV